MKYSEGVVLLGLLLTLLSPISNGADAVCAENTGVTQISVFPQIQERLIEKSPSLPSGMISRQPLDLAVTNSPHSIESTAESPELDPKGTEAPEYFKDRPRQALGAVESQRVDHLSGKEVWQNSESFRARLLFDVPEWMDLTIENRVRFEDYSTPWRGGAPSGQSFVGQNAVLNQLTVWSEIRFNMDWRAGIEFMDGRALWSGPKSETFDASTQQFVTQDTVNLLNSSMVNTGQFAQIFLANIERDIFKLAVDSETKLGQMTMNLGSMRLVGRPAYGNTQRQYVGMQQRLLAQDGGWELTLFANTPELMEPGTVTPSDPSSRASTLKAMSNNVIWNRPQTNTYFTGALFSTNIDSVNQSEIYLFYLHEGSEVILNRRLFTPGFRFFKPNSKGEVNYEFESIGQTGSSVLKASTANLNANFYGSEPYTEADPSASSTGYLSSRAVTGFYQHIHIGYTFDVPMDPRLTTVWDYGTSHFDQLFGTSVFEFGPTGIGGFFTRTNINSPGFKFEFIPHRDVSIYLMQRWWWMADAYSTSGWLGSNIYNVEGGKNYQGGFIGETIELNARWDAHENVGIQAGWQILMKGNLASYGTGAVGVGYTSYNASLSSDYFSGSSIHPNGSNVNLFYTQMMVRF